MTKDALSFLRSSFEETEALVNTGAKIQHPVSRGLAPNQEPHLQVPEKSSQKELEAMALGTASDAIEIVSGSGGPVITGGEAWASWVPSPGGPGPQSSSPPHRRGQPRLPRVTVVRERLTVLTSRGSALLTQVLYLLRGCLFPTLSPLGLDCCCEAAVSLQLLLHPLWQAAENGRSAGHSPSDEQLAFPGLADGKAHLFTDQGLTYTFPLPTPVGPCRPNRPGLNASPTGAPEHLKWFILVTFMFSFTS